VTNFIDRKSVSDPLRRRLRRLTRGERLEEAHAFLDLFHREGLRGGAEHAARRREVGRELSRHGFYRHTPEELAFGARVAWRNHSRCIGRLFWKSLDVLDCRHMTGPDEVAGQSFRHLDEAYADGRIRSTISVFAPVEGDELPVWIESRQLSQYAGYVRPEGVLGDPANAEMTRIAVAMGWRPPADPGSFDLLPLLLRDRQGRRRLYETPAGTVREIPIAHPDHPALGALGLRWYAVPVVSDMILTIGGIDYPCAPFNGWYMATEIASRNLVDPFRYDLMEPVADAIGADRATDPLWKDRVLTELNRAVLHAFAKAEVAIVDHHLASEQYMEFDRAERANDRIPSADWAWITPPQASAACEVFHHGMQDLHDVPNFYRSRTGDGARLGVSHATEWRGRMVSRFERVRRRWRNWRRGRD
jgi:nitric-oxide synthase, bacterial